MLLEMPALNIDSIDAKKNISLIWLINKEGNKSKTKQC